MVYDSLSPSLSLTFIFPYAAGTKMDSEDAKEKLVVITLYVAIGLSVFAMCFKLMQEEVVDKVKWFASKVGIIKGKDKKKVEKAP
ncbi:hypothetical protein T265_05792 [Opisthorchis viverrini]|uniref:Uncharacterized protein n=1 Tax=Opisthorchis viverrini TaxID=6198 RepID=A0A075AEV3_OPIVI|nr:hypothetical protein T265_05792 [Opisthorchis viverrini]KER27094.1 hypothetical protein T265_05792 [Opisthorchis viverrini]